MFPCFFLDLEKRRERKYEMKWKMERGKRKRRTINQQICAYFDILSSEAAGEVEGDTEGDAERDEPCPPFPCATGFGEAEFLAI